jgi:hypothetical protein
VKDEDKMSEDRTTTQGFGERQPSQAVTAAKTTGLVAAAEFDDVSPVGLEKPRQEELKRSFLYLLQQGSRAAMKGSPEYVDGAEPGMFFNTGSRRVYKTVEFVPVHRALKFLEWVPIDAGGGFKGEYGPDDEYVNRFRNKDNRFSAIKTDQGTELVQTFELWALIGEPGFGLDDAELVNIPCTSIKIRAYNDWYDNARRLRYQNSAGVLVTPPIFSHRWHLTSVFEEKWKPSGAFNIRIGLAAPTKEGAFLRGSDPLRQEAASIYAMIEAGSVRADYAAAAEREPGEDDDTPPM